MEKFSDFISEQKNEQPYKIVCFYHTGDSLRDFNNDDHLEMIKVMKKADVPMHFIDYFGTYLSSKGNDTFINYLKIDDKSKRFIPPSLKGGGGDYDKPLKISTKDTLILYRDLPTDKSSWKDMIFGLEVRGFTLLNNIECFRICGSKYLTDVHLRMNNIRTPKAIRVLHSEDSERAIKELGSKFPVVLKLSSGSQTGVGVTLIDNMRTLHSTVQMALLVDNNLSLLIQEYIPIDYDIRAVVLGNEVVAAIKRNVIKGTDFRSNVSLGAKAEMIELTDLEKKIAIKSSKAVKGVVTGVDMFPSKNRETEEPYVLEVNSNPGFGGVEAVHPGTTKKIFDYFKNRENWRKL